MFFLPAMFQICLLGNSGIKIVSEFPNCKYNLRGCSFPNSKKETCIYDNSDSTEGNIKPTL